MRGVKNPLDFVFLDKSFAIVDMIKTVVPQTGTTTSPPGTAYAVELAAGGIDHYQLQRGTIWVELTNEVLNGRR